RPAPLAGADAGTAAGPAAGERAAAGEAQADTRSHDDGAAMGSGPESGRAEAGGAGQQASRRQDDGASAEPHVRVMVTLVPAPPPIWNQITVDLERTYRLRTVFAWSMQSLGERCIVFEA